MAIFALVTDGIVENIVESQDVLVLENILPETKGHWVEQTDETLFPTIGLPFLNGKFQTPQPFATWAWNTEQGLWEPPIPYPSENGFHVWDEEQATWVVASEPAAQVNA